MRIICITNSGHHQEVPGEHWGNTQQKDMLLRKLNEQTLIYNFWLAEPDLKASYPNSKHYEQIVGFGFL